MSGGTKKEWKYSRNGAIAMTQIDLDELKRLCEEATLGPWKHKLFVGGWDGVTCEKYGAICALRYNNPANASFIAASREAIPELIEGIEALIEFINAEMGELPQYDKDVFAPFIQEKLL